METEKKLDVLAKVAHELNATGITWAVGGSMLLYFHGITDAFQDIDLMVKTEDGETAKTVLLKMGVPVPSKAKAQYQTKMFLEFTVDGVEIDMMAGFSIVKDGRVYDCSLKAEEIEETIQLKNERIPLHSVAQWRKNYELMEKPDKVRMIDAAAEKKKPQ